MPWFLRFTKPWASINYPKQGIGSKIFQTQGLGVSGWIRRPFSCSILSITVWAKPKFHSDVDDSQGVRLNARFLSQKPKKKFSALFSEGEHRNATRRLKTTWVIKRVRADCSGGDRRRDRRADPQPRGGYSPRWERLARAIFVSLGSASSAGRVRSGSE
jgi:hypothetical protein